MKFWQLCALVGMFGSSMAQAQSQPSSAQGIKAPWGLGLAIGGISGISGYHRLDNQHFAQGALAFSLYGNSVAVTGDYGILVPKLFEFSKFVTAYYGIGGVLVKEPHTILFGTLIRRDVLFIGARIPLGVQFFIPDTPLQLGLELTPGIFIVPATLVFIDATFLVRFMF